MGALHKLILLSVLLIISVKDVHASVSRSTSILNAAQTYEREGKYKKALSEYEKLKPLAFAPAPDPNQPKEEREEEERIEWGRREGIVNVARKLLQEKPMPKKTLELMWKISANNPEYGLNWLKVWEASDISSLPKEQIVTLPSFSVVVPCYNCAKTVIKSLESLTKSLQYLENKCKSVPALSDKVPRAQIVLVNDASTDDSEKVIRDFIATQPKTSTIEYDFYVNSVNKGHGGARNRALKEATGEVFLFLDADDLFYEEHIYLSLVFLQVSGLPWSQTIMAASDPIHQDWTVSLSNTLLLTKALTRRVIEFLEGFPDLGNYGGEDAIFYMGLNQYFPHKSLILKPTVEYCRYPGNGFDVQYAKFSRSQKDPSPPEEKKEETDRDRAIGAAHKEMGGKAFALWMSKAKRIAAEHAANIRNAPKKKERKQPRDEL